MEPQIQYATTADGIDIACWSAGEGPTIVLTPNTPWSHCQLEWHDPDYQAWFRRLLRGHRVVRFDARGCGLSDRSATKYSLETMLLDLDAVVERLGLEKFDLFGSTQGGPAAIAYAAAHPERVEHLLLWCTFSSHEDLRLPQLNALARLARADFHLYTETLAHALATGWDEGKSATRIAALWRKGASIEAFEGSVAAFQEIDVRSLLASVAVPTLILQRRDAPVPSVAAAQGMASRIPGARLVLLEGRSLIPAVGDLETAVAAIDRFTIGEVPPVIEEFALPAPGANTLRTLLCSDIVGHTSMMRALGDSRGRDVLREYETITRSALREFGGVEVKTMGDGFLASFPSAQRALECAIAMQRQFADATGFGPGEAPGLPVRIGLNAGEPIAEEDDLYGAAVIAAERIAGMAEGGEVLVSNVVRELVAGKGFLLADRGESAINGLEEPVRLYELRWAA